MPHFSQGEEIYKFKLIRHIGTGSFGQVWLCQDTLLDKEFAVKIIDTPRKDFVDKVKEAQIGKKLTHRNLLQIEYADIVEYNNAPLTLIAQEFMPKGAVTSKLTSKNFLTLPDALRFAKSICSGLEALHNEGIYHNDIKPTNILINGADDAVLSDYGLAVVSTPGLPTPAGMMYLPHKAPEIHSTNTITIQTDIYQLGMTLYRLVNDIYSIKSEFEELDPQDFQVMQKKGKLPDPNGFKAWVPKALRRIIKKATAVDTSERYTNVMAIVRDLEKLNFPAYWTVDTTGHLVGIGQNYDYRMETKARPNSRFDFIAYKKNRVSGRETMISKFAQPGLSKKQAEVAEEKFISWVVLNGA